ncbi:MAG: mechanosensitive ion channel family protein, partial [Corynebacterium glucuronolyticum]|nr:mechanosensitive ion channel family protein [Corynebacterium glucuronolyticum]
MIAILIALVGQWLITWAIKKFSTYQKEKPLTSFLPVKSSKEAELVDYESRARQERKRARIDTLASVARSTALIVIWAWAVLEILRNLGVNVAPIIASAGVVGLAVGFGAQSLVKDFLAGIFMLMEDQYGVGDTIDV